MRVASLPEDTGVDLGAQAEAAPAVAPVEADAAEPFVLRELAHGYLEDTRGLVESHEGSIIICG